MTCADHRAALSAHLDGEAVGSDGLGGVDSHPAECGACRDWLARARRLQAMTRAAPGPSAEWSEQLVARLLGAVGGGMADGASGRPG